MPTPTFHSKIIFGTLVTPDMKKCKSPLTDTQFLYLDEKIDKVDDKLTGKIDVVKYLVIVNIAGGLGGAVYNDNSREALITFFKTLFA